MKLFLMILLSVGMLLSYGQNTGVTVDNREVQQVHLVYDQHEFGDRFSVFTFSDENYDYYVIDLTKLKDTFERVYFMNLSYNEPKIINLDSDLEKDQLWFKTYYTNKENEVTCLFNDLKEKTDKAAVDMNAEEKSAWMAKFNKFKKDSNNE